MASTRHTARFVLGLLLAAFGGLVFAQSTLDGMPRVAQWTDLESQAGDLPVNVWGACAVQRANRVGIRVDFNSGETGFATYDGVAAFWNTADFGPVPAATSGGFFATCGGLHFLFDNKNVDLPMAWEGCSNGVSPNFDLDANEDIGSNFRAAVPAWVSANFQTYCGDLLGAAAVPAVTPAWFVAAALALSILGALALRRRAG